jgi:hypothetical protein
LSELELKLKDASAAIVILSWMEAANEASANALQGIVTSTVFIGQYLPLGGSPFQ